MKIINELSDNEYQVLKNYDIETFLCFDKINRYWVYGGMIEFRHRWIIAKDNRIQDV
jgi:hypothetical protein